MENFSFKLAPFLTNQNLRVAENTFFHDFNLVIGKNGSGKTRFLKAVEEYYRRNPPEKETVVTLYFPEISSFFSSEYEQISETNPTVELETAIFQGESLSFQDFLKLAQRDNVTFLNDFFMFMSAQARGTRLRYQDDFDRLNKQLGRFLGWQLDECKTDSKITGHKLLDDQPCDSLPLLDMLRVFSPGELMLFYFCLFLFYLQHVNESQLILIIDEPEQHLHPKALVDLIDVLRNSKSIEQLWVASHSLFLLPLFDFEQMIYIKQNKIKKLNRDTYLEIYNDLVGIDNEDMYELLRSVENWAYYQFITENFFLPTSKDTVNTSDEQFQKLLCSLQSIRDNRPLKVLDYGAGKFRIWKCFQLELPDYEDQMRVLCYEAYEPHMEEGIKCPDTVTVYKKESELPHGKYDVVVLMNVLHEIDPTEWCQNLKTIYRVLTEEGVLVFLEVLSLTNGEQPYGEAGYLLLQEQETKFLFPNAQQVLMDNVNKSNKSNCFVIPRSDLENVTMQNVIEAIGRLEINCETQLERLDRKRIALAHRNDKGDRKNIKATARQYAFLAQQYINAHIAYKRMSQHPLHKSSSEANTDGKIPIRGLKK